VQYYISVMFVLSTKMFAGLTADSNSDFLLHHG
jgi:hypothetical protein